MSDSDSPKLPVNPNPVTPDSPSVTPTPTDSPSLPIKPSKAFTKSGTATTDSGIKPSDSGTKPSAKAKLAKAIEEVGFQNPEVEPNRIIDLNPLLSSDTWKEIHFTLLKYGMDSQQANKALNALVVIFAANSV